MSFDNQVKLKLTPAFCAFGRHAISMPKFIIGLAPRPTIFAAQRAGSLRGVIDEAAIMAAYMAETFN